ncbi:MAG: sigma-70 family RNA polymerase sigma factor [Clostridia bacterium]
MDTAFEPSDVRDVQLTHLMDTYGSRIVKVCYTYLKDVALAEDAAQDTFVKAYGQLGQSWAMAHEKAWLMQIAVNTCKDYLRTSWFRKVDRSITPEDLADQTAQDVSEGRILLDDVLELPLKYREIIILYYYQNLRVGDIEQILGIARSTIHARLDKARQKLRITLEGGYDDE